jgi:cell division protein FtsN
VAEIDKNDIDEIPQESSSSSGSSLNNVLKLLSFGVIAILSYLILTTSLKTCGKHDITYANGQKYGEEEFDESSNSALNDTTFTTAQDTSEVNNSLVKDKPIDTITSTTTKLNPKPNSTAPASGGAENSASVIKPETQELIKPTPKTTSTPDIPNNKSVDNNNSILVIAGNYIQESNAKELQKKLAKAGIKNTEIIVFDFSEFHTVIVGRYKDIASAKKMVSTLKSKGFESYTHQKRKK